MSELWYVNNEPRLRSQDTLLVGPGRFTPRRVKRSIVDRPKSRVRGPSPYNNPFRVRKDLKMNRTPTKNVGPKVQVGLQDPGLTDTDTEGGFTDVSDRGAAGGVSIQQILEREVGTVVNKSVDPGTCPTSRNLSLLLLLI